MAERCGTVVVVDVLSFTTTTSIACAKGSIVMPSPGGEHAVMLATATGATLVNPSREPTTDNPWTLSPASIAAASAAERLVLPSPNGSAICRLVMERSPAPEMLAASLRNADASARALGEAPRPIGVVAAGERWPGGELRPAIEDLIGAGRLLAMLEDRAGDQLDTPALLTARAVGGLDVGAIREAIAGSLSGLELVERGFATDVELACELDVEPAVRWNGEGFVAVESSETSRFDDPA